MQNESNTIGAYEAKTHFSELLARVARGEEVVITKHGTAIARLVPAGQTTSVEQRRATIVAMRKLASQNRLRGLKIKDLINEGRR